MPRAKRTPARIVDYYRKRGESDEYIRTLARALADSCPVRGKDILEELDKGK